MNVGVKARTLEKFRRAEQLIAGGLEVKIALKRVEIATSTYYKLKGMYEPLKTKTS